MFEDEHQAVFGVFDDYRCFNNFALKNRIKPRVEAAPLLTLRGFVPHELRQNHPKQQSLAYAPGGSIDKPLAATGPLG